MTWGEFKELCRSRTIEHIRSSECPSVAPISKEASQSYKKGRAIGSYIAHLALDEMLFSCSKPDGTCLRLETRKLAFFSEPSQEFQSELVSYDFDPIYDEWPAPEGWLEMEESHSFMFIDDATGIIRNYSGPSPDATFFCQSSSLICDAELIAWFESEFAMANALASRFEGAALCIRPGNAEAIISYWLSEMEDEGALAGKVGRPQVRGAAAAAYHKLYPDGHGSHSWKMVARSIAELIGREVSPASIRRGLADFEQIVSQNPEQ